MQLDKIVNVHKVLGDPNRMRILMMLSGGEMNGQMLAQRLHLSQPTVTFHASKLRENGLVRERRDKNHVYFSLQPEFIREIFDASLSFIFNKGGESSMDLATNETFQAAVLKNFFGKDGRLRSIPAQYKKKLVVLEYMVEQLSPGREYSEKEINEFIKTFHEDFATIRREFIMHEYMYRENGIYVRNPREMWMKWEEVH